MTKEQWLNEEEETEPNWLSKTELMLVVLVAAFAMAWFTIPIVQGFDWNTDVFAYYSLDEAPSSTIMQSNISGAGNFSNNGAVTGQTGMLGNSVYFDGSGNINGGGFSSHTSFSLNFWMNKTGVWTNLALFQIDATDNVNAGCFEDAGAGKVCIFPYDTTVGAKCIILNLTDTAMLNNSNWHMLTITTNGSANSTKIYIDGMLRQTTQSDGATTNPVVEGNSTFGERRDGWGDFTGRIDEIGYFNKTLNETDITYLYNSGTGITFPTPPKPNVTLVSPANASTVTNTYQQFICTGTPDTYPIVSANFSLWNSTGINIYNAYNLNSGGDCYQESANTFNQSGKDGDCGLSYTGAYIFNDSTRWNHQDIVLNGEWETAYDLTNYVYIEDTSNYLYINYSKPSNVTSALWEVSGKDGTQYNGVYYDTNLSLLSSCFSYNTTAIILRIRSGAYAIGRYVDYECYNGTWNVLLTKTYSAHINGIYEEGVHWDTSNKFVFNYNLPKQDTYYWNCLLTDSQGRTKSSLSNYTLILNYPSVNVTQLPCPNYNLHYTLWDEQNFSSLNGTFDYNYRLQQIGGSNYSVNGSLGVSTKYHDLYLCANTNETFYALYGEVDYQVSGYEMRRWYLFNGTQITNASINISLYDLVHTEATAFQLSVESPSQIYYSNKYIHTLRWYPQNNSYYTTDIGVTDGSGNTIIYIDTQDADYRFALYEQNGTLISISNPIRLICATTPCTYTWRILGTNYDFSDFLNIQYSFIFNSNLSMWYYTWSDPSQKTQNMNMSIWRDTPSSSYVICNSLGTGYIGTISCNTTGYSGTLRGEVERIASPPVPIAQLIINTATSVFKSEWGLWLSFIIAIPVAFFLIMVSPIAAVIGGILALIPALILGSINLGIFSGIVVLGGIIAHLVKRVSYNGNCNIMD